MNATTLVLVSAAIAGAAPAAPPPDAAPTIVARPAGHRPSAAGARLPGFAARLAGTAAITGPDGWPSITPAAAWAALAAATPATRQAARWAHVRSLIGGRRGQEALGVLAVMRADDGDLGLVDNFQLALGVARAESGDARGALAMLGPGTPGSGALAANPEACAWRLWSFAALGEAEAALGQAKCSLRALNARPPAARAPFLYAGARAALASGRPGPVADWLRALPDDDAGANLYRGRAALALGDLAGARLRLARVAGGDRQQQVDARVSLLEAELATARATPAQVARLDQFAFTWRGDAIEQRVLLASYRVGRERHDLRRSLGAGATLVRYFPAAPGSPALLDELRHLLADGLAPQSTLPIVAAAGLYWDYRDLAPVGAQGDFLASQLADRLERDGLYTRAAELLRHQLVARASDIAQGPLSARVAALYLLAGRPALALAALHDSDTPAYPAAMRWQRQRMAAVALAKLGRRAEALAAVEGVPDAAVIRAEILWKARDWPALVASSAPQLPDAARLDAVGQAIVLRHAIALAMLGREPALATLRRRYLAGFAGVPAAATFDLMTRDPLTLEPEALTAAMLAIPSVSPAGVVGDLLDAPMLAPPARPATATAGPISADSRRG